MKIPRSIRGGLLLSLFLSAPVVVADGQAQQLQLTYLGAAGWEMKQGRTVVLVDPYISRIKYAGGGRELDDGRKNFEGSDVPVLETRLIDKLVPKADYILVHHGHPDHLLDVPYIAKKTGAKVIATETVNNILRGYAIPEEQLYTVRGGEDYEFGDVSIRVVPSLHSALAEKRYFRPQKFTEKLPAPVKIEDFIEGGSLMFLCRFTGVSVLTMGSMNFIENELLGVAPDVLLAGAGASRTEIYNYTARLLTATGFPRIVIPTHWDNFYVPYEDVAAHLKARKEKLEPFMAEAAAASPRSRVIAPEHLKPIVIPGR